MQHRHVSNLFQNISSESHGRFGLLGRFRESSPMSLKQNKDDLLQMMETDMATNTVAECNVYNDKDECLSDDNQAECPFYADNACFNHRTEDISADGEIDYRIIKGCSAFFSEARMSRDDNWWHSDWNSSVEKLKIDLPRTAVQLWRTLVPQRLR